METGGKAVVEEQYKLQLLTEKLNRAVRKGKDLGKEKYLKYYNRCKSLRDKLEKEALESLDSGDANKFEEVAEVIHDAAAAIERYDTKAKVKTASTKEKEKGAPEHVQESDEPDNWANFSEDFGRGTPIYGHHSTKESLRHFDGRGAYQPGEHEYQHQSGERETVAVGEGNRQDFKDPRHRGVPSPDVEHYREEKVENGFSYELQGERRSTLAAPRMERPEGPQQMGSYVPQKSRTGISLKGPGSEKKEGLSSRLTSTGGKTPDAASVAASNLSYTNVAHNRKDDVRDRYKQLEQSEAEIPVTERRRQQGNKTIGIMRQPLPQMVEEEVDPRCDDECDYARYAGLMEKCLMFSDCHELGSRILGKPLELKIQECDAFIDEHVTWATDGHDQALASVLLRSVAPEDLDMAGRRNARVRTREESPRLDVEPLWRIKEDGGVSCYMGRFLTEGGALFDSFYFSVSLGLCAVQGSNDVEVQIEVTAKLSGIDVITWLDGEGIDTIHILDQSPTWFSFLCDPTVWSYCLPELVVEVLESDGTKRKFLIKLPIGPSTLLEPVDISNMEIDRIIENGPDVGFYTMQKKFLPREKIELPKLLSALSRHFFVRKANITNALAAIDNNYQIVVLTIQAEGNIIAVNLWSSSEKAMSSAYGHVKEVAAYVCAVRDKKLAETALRFHSVFPLCFEDNPKLNRIPYPVKQSNLLNQGSFTSRRNHEYRVGHTGPTPWFNGT